MAERRKHPSVGWIPAGPINVASSRLQAFLPQDRLAGEGFRSVLLRRPERLRRKIKAGEVLPLAWRILTSGVDTVVFQKTALAQAPLVMGLCRLLGKRVIYVECDSCADTGFTRHVDAIVAPSRALAAEMAARSGRPVLRIPDPVEHWDRARLARPWRVTAGPRPAAVWVGNAMNWEQLVRLRADLAALGEAAPFTVTAISNHPEAEIPWTRDGVAAAISGFDLGVIPAGDGPGALLKSENRATLFMALGLPVAVEESPVYAGLIRDGDTGFVWRDRAGLAALAGRLADAAGVEAVRARGLAAAEPFSEDEVMALWRGLLIERRLPC